MRVDEEGTEAAAATAILMTRGIALPFDAVSMRFDIPFSFWVLDESNCVSLFSGRFEGR